MSPHLQTVWDSAQHMADNLLARLPSLVVAVVVFLAFYFASAIPGRLIRRATYQRRRNVG